MNIKAKMAKTIIMAATVSLLTVPAMAGYGPGDGTGNAGSGPKDGTGYGAKKGVCIDTIDSTMGADYIARGGNGSGPAYRLRTGGGYGPGDGTGNGGSGPKDGTGNGAKKGTCINS